MAVAPLNGANRELFHELIGHHIRFSLAKRWTALTRRDWYRATALVVRDMLAEKMLATRARFERAGAKTLYYLSLEFLIGRSLENNLINLGIYDAYREFLGQNGVDPRRLFDEEPDAALGNGGLGRLAACYLDSLATMDMPGYAYGINYEYGIFRQEIRGGYQVEHPDSWQREASPWLIPRPEDSCLIPVYGRVEEGVNRHGEPAPKWVDCRVLVGVPSDLPIAGFGGRTVNYVRLYSAGASAEFDMQIFNSGDYLKAVEQKMVSETVSKVLYPSDSIQAGRELRLLQEYFFAACAVRDIVRTYLRRGEEDFGNFPAKVAIQLNDTHPAMTIAELMRTLIDQQGVPWNTAWEITRAAVAYTNHTLMPEALERWPAGLLERVVPRHLQIIYEINRRFMGQAAEVFGGDRDCLRRVSITEDGGEPNIRMANLAIVGSHSINGVSKIHSELLRTRLAADFYRLWPERFSNKTNGVTQRRWLLMANPGLAKLLDDTIGAGWRTKLEQLIGIERFADDADFHQRFHTVKRANKERLARLMNRLAAVDADPSALFDVQAKRIHEYKRQLLMALGIVHKYLALAEDGIKPEAPRVYVMAGKAAPGYWAAKMIIKLINNIAQVINNDERVGNLIKVAFLPDYRVSLAEVIIPAADLSEHISTAGREASGTGNMKFAMNGALTIGTCDGANLEIRDAVGAENIFLFGLPAPRIEELAAAGAYRPLEFYESDPRIRRVLDEIASDRFCPGEPGLFRWVRDALLTRDDYFVLADFAAYIGTQNEIARQFKQPQLWTKKTILNVARMGWFSSDRAVAEYARDIWDLHSVPEEPLPKGGAA